MPFAPGEVPPTSIQPSRLRVVHIVEACLGGVRKHLLDLCQGLDAARFELTAILAPGRDPDPEATRALLQAAGVEVIQVPMRRGLAPASDRRCLREIEAHLRRIQPQVVHCHSAKAGYLGRLAAKRAAVPGVIYTPHGFPFTMRARWPWRRLYRQVERRLARVTSRIICVCESEREVALRAKVASPEQLTVIPNGVEFGPAPEVERTAKRDALGLPPGARAILCVGDARPQKGYSVAIRAMPNLVKRDGRAHLLIAGKSGSEATHLLEGLAGMSAVGPGLTTHLHCLGPRDDVPELLAACDVFCMPSLWEGCPYALIEAAGAGCAIVASDIPGISDIITDGETGWLFPAGDVAALAAALITALRDPTERLRRGAAAACYAREHHRLDRMLELTAALYEDAARPPP